jgi:hypothetical protein
MERDTAVSKETGYELDDFGSIPDTGLALLFAVMSRPPLRPTWSTIQLVRGIKRLEPEGDSSPRLVLFTNAWSYESCPPYVFIAL